MNELCDKILLTGATGMLGAHLLWHLLQKGARVRALKRKRSDFEQTELIFHFYNDKLSRYVKQIEWVEGDVLDVLSVEKAMQGIDTVYHCAAKVSFSNQEDNLTDINVKGTQHVVDAALKNGVRRFCFVSSIGALSASVKEGMVDECCFGIVEANGSAYSRSKYYSEKIVCDAIDKGLPAVIVNPGVIMGYAKPGNGTMQLFTMVRNGLQVYTNGGSGYVCVDDVCRAMILLTESVITGERFILVSENLSNHELLNMIADSLKVGRPFINAFRPLLMSVAWVMEIIQKITGKKAFIDRATARVTLNRTYYSSEKINHRIGFEFTPIQACVEKIGAVLIRENQTVSTVHSI
ncbi:MAG: SDR family oxidoreductase [Paludibacteraceae bacterium]|nr:SDR family oxidoreductase [Paludibacteraceae bacterium]